MLNVPAPSVPPGKKVLEKSIDIGLSGLAFDDGSPVTSSEAAMVGLLVFRGAEVWDEAGKGWRASPGDSDLIQMSPVPALPDGTGWKATLVTTGPKDSGGAAVYSAGTSYRVRGLARAYRDGADIAGLSPPSPDFSFVSAVANQRFTIAFDTPSTPPDEAEIVRLQLKDNGLIAAGYVEIRAGGREVILASCDTAGVPRSTILLRSDGSIHLNPAAGQRVVVGGDFEVEHLLYRPLLGGLKKWL